MKMDAVGLSFCCFCFAAVVAMVSAAALVVDAAETTDVVL